MGRKSRAKRERRNLDPEARLALVTAAKSKRAAPPDKPLKVTDASFDAVVGNSDLPVLVDFWASWCRPCKMVAPILDQLAKEMQGELKIVKYNTEENQRVAQALNIRSLTTMVLFKDGEVIDVQIGVTPAERLRRWIAKRIAPKRSLLGRLIGRDDETRPSAGIL